MHQPIDNNVNDSVKTLAIILAAGQGKRMNTSTSKQYLEVLGKPIIVYTISQFLENPWIDQVMLVVSPDMRSYMEEEIVNRFFVESKSEIIVVLGGKERYDSVYSALKESAQVYKKILIHDGARPLITQPVITKVIQALDSVDACIVGVKAKDTFKLVDETGLIRETIDREKLYTIQTPQGFHRDTILNAYTKGIGKAKAYGVTDDSMMVELFSESSIKIVNGEYTNIKITTPEDLIMMEKILLADNNML